jgi:hypothetical protein
MYHDVCQCRSIIFPSPASNSIANNPDKIYSPQIGHPHIGQVLKMTGFCGDGGAAKPIACGPDVGHVLNATDLPGSGGCLI